MNKITLRLVKGEALTYSELDNNFTVVQELAKEIQQIKERLERFSVAGYSGKAASSANVEAVLNIIYADGQLKIISREGDVWVGQKEGIGQIKEGLSSYKAYDIVFSAGKIWRAKQDTEKLIDVKEADDWHLIELKSYNSSIERTISFDVFYDRKEKKLWIFNGAHWQSIDEK